MKLCIISDTHGRHEQLQKLPEADVLICCGDITGSTQRDALKFNDWLGAQPHPEKLVIAGNHDFVFVQNKGEDVITNGTYLRESATTIDGVKFYGSPWTPTFGDWAFMRPSEVLAEFFWSDIPEDTQVLITHGPPREILDRTTIMGDRAGCPALRARLEHLPELRLHCFGHIHEEYGCVSRQVAGRFVDFVNASIVGAPFGGGSLNKPVVISL